MRLCITLTLLFLAVASAAGLAHEDIEHETSYERVTHEFKTMEVVLGGMAAVLVLTGFAAHFKSRMSKKEQKAIFVVIAAVALGVTFYLLATTILLNAISVTGGPVHWHADFEIWECGEPVALRGPEGFLSNRVGPELLHHHDDYRIHVEGVVLDMRDVSLASFFRGIGGRLEESFVTVPTPLANATYQNRGLCNGSEAELQVFVYRTTGGANPNFVYEQAKLDDFTNYVPSPHSAVPPGDCVIIEFDAPKPSTDKVCESYKVEIEKGNLVEGD